MNSLTENDRSALADVDAHLDGQWQLDESLGTVSNFHEYFSGKIELDSVTAFGINLVALRDSLKNAEGQVDLSFRNNAADSWIKGVKNFSRTTNPLR